MFKTGRWLAALSFLLMTAMLVTGCADQSSNLNSPQPADDIASELPEPMREPEPVPESEPPETEQADQDEPIAKVNSTYYTSKSFYMKPTDESANKNVVLLTFDDGPKDEQLLVNMLDTLDKYEAKAIFFVNGYRVKAKPELLRLIDERGHAIGNHSWDHIVLSKQPEEKIDQQLEDVQSIVQETIGKTPRFFRPPNGAGNDYIRNKSSELGMIYMTWSNGSLDWADNKNKPDGIVATVMEQLAPGSNILMHELSWTAEALDSLLAAITAEGYSFIDPQYIVTVQE